MKTKIIIVSMTVIVIVLILVIILTSSKNSTNLEAEKYKKILLQLGYSEDDIWDKKFVDDNLNRWVGISGFKLYACLFEYNSSNATKIKKQEIEENFSISRKQKILYLKMEKNKLIVIASDEEHKEEANKIIEKITNN